MLTFCASLCWRVSVCPCWQHRPAILWYAKNKSYFWNLQKQNFFIQCLWSMFLQLLNSGPSTISKASLDVLWPHRLKDDFLLYITSFKTDGPINCTTDQEINPLNVSVTHAHTHIIMLALEKIEFVRSWCVCLCVRSHFRPRWHHRRTQAWSHPEKERLKDETGTTSRKETWKPGTVRVTSRYWYHCRTVRLWSCCVLLCLMLCVCVCVSLGLCHSWLSEAPLSSRPPGEKTKCHSLYLC